METTKIRFIPDQTDSVGSSLPTAHNNPLYLIWLDIRVLISLARLLPKLFLPFSTTKKSDELYLRWPNSRNLFVCVAITLIGVFLLVAVLVTFLLCPGFVSLPAAVAALLWVMAACSSSQGPTVIRSVPNPKNGGITTYRPDEKWIFVNGVLNTGYSFRRNCDRLARTFGRPITGIHNPTYGFVGDLLECVVQRSFSYNTLSTRVAYDYVKEALVDPAVKKVVLIGHSQGGIIISMVLDMLYADLSSHDVQKLEIYTFGSAASHFNNPLSHTSPLAPCTGVIKHIEHYVNEEDLVPRWGVLYSAESRPRNRYAGKVFVRMGATGHLLNQHYLSRIFPLSDDLHGEEPCFLSQAVNADEYPHDVPGRLVQTGFSSSKARDRSPQRHENPKTTVREISRLWRYMGGKDADDETTFST